MFQTARSKRESTCFRVVPDGCIFIDLLTIIVYSFHKTFISACLICLGRENTAMLRWEQPTIRILQSFSSNLTIHRSLVATLYRSIKWTVLFKLCLLLSISLGITLNTNLRNYLTQRLIATQSLYQKKTLVCNFSPNKIWGKELVIYITQ